MNRILKKPGYRFLGEMLAMASAITLMAVWITLIGQVTG
jgi:hypothetical protein